MSVVISVFSQKAYKEYMLPARNNTDVQIVLKKQLFGLKNNAILNLEVLNHRWYFRESICKIVFDESQKASQELKNQESCMIETLDRERLYAIIWLQSHPFKSYAKYDLRNMSEVLIGSSSEADISYSYVHNGVEYVSSEHAILKRMSSGWSVEDISANGSFLNNCKINGKAILEYGNHLNIWGLDIIFLEDIIALNQNMQVNVNPSVLFPWKEDESVIQENNSDTVQKVYYHRAPRYIEPLETAEVEIEIPPVPKEKNDTPLFMQIGPALTMTLPMLLGSGMAVISSRMTGISSIGFMYTGLITAGCSGLIGAFWALKNVKYAEKKRKRDELQRQERYNEYLIKCTERIKKMYEHNMWVLQERYPSTQQLIGNGNQIPDEIWGRNVTHEDFLYHRLGIGDIPFQAPILIPKERFSVIRDELSDNPRLIKEKYEILHQMPVGIDLIKNRLIGIVGGQGKVGAYPIVYNLITQIITQNCYTDVKLIFVCQNEDGNAVENWEFASWLPHVWSETKKMRYISYNQSESGDIFYEITKILRSRLEENIHTSNQDNHRLLLPYYIMFVEDEELISGESVERYVFDKTTNIGLTTILLAERYEQLPNTCECIIQNDSMFSGIFNMRAGTKQKEPIHFDEMPKYILNNFARVMANIEVNETEAGGEIPATITFFDMYGVGKPDDFNVIDRWLKNRTYESLRALIGCKAGGQPCYLDLHEKYHGPHGLVAGTTGSGKSETLQSYMLSLAINFSPNDVSFFIIDYKGGGMGNLFSGLPHVLGQISNLSGNMIRRAMVSIKSENLRRQKLFNENEVNNINSYAILYKNGEAKIPVPHLFIVIDEFAELKKEEPEFMRELISVAQVGRSLGVHLILATQKPAGTVDDNIWSNARFHLCLRVQDRQDSMDMLHKPDAAYLTNTGRGYLQVGSDEVYEQFQSGWSGALYDEEEGNSKQVIAKMITRTGRTAITGNYIKSRKNALDKQAWIAMLLQCLEQVLKQGEEKEPELLLMAWMQLLEKREIDYPSSEHNKLLLRNLMDLYFQAVQAEKKTADALPNISTWVLEKALETRMKLPEKKEKTQLEAVVEYLAQLAEEMAYEKQQPLWLPPLPEKLFLDQIVPKYHAEQSESWILKAEIGLCDDPENQMQFPLTINFSEDGNCAVCGVGRSGKSTFIQTIVYSLIKHYSPDTLNIYILDFSSRMQESFESAPQMGGILFENDLDTIEKFFHLIRRMTEERKALFRGGNYSQYIRKYGIVCPAVLIAIDNVGSFREKTEGKYDDELMKLSRECVANGIYLLLSGASYGTADIPPRMSDTIRRTICLEMPDKFQCLDALNTLQIEIVPETGIPGRGLVKIENRCLEFQTCLAVEAQDDYSRNEKIKLECGQISESWSGKPARGIPFIPPKPVWSQFKEQKELVGAIADSALLPIGYESKTADICFLDLSGIYCFLIIGKARTGKSNLMRIMMQTAKLKKAHLCIVEFDDNKIKNDAYELQANYISTCEEYYQFLLDLLPIFQKRNNMKKECCLHVIEEKEIYDCISKEEPYFIFIADLVAFTKVMHSKEGMEKNLDRAMTNILEKGSLLNIYFVACLNGDRSRDAIGKSVYETYISYKTGIHLGGNADEQRILDFPGLSMQEKAKVRKPGYGLMMEPYQQSTIEVVIPFAKG